MEEQTYTQYKHSDEYIPYLWDGNYKTSLKYLDGFKEAEILKEAISGEFYMKVKFSEIRNNIYLNGKPIIYKPSKGTFPGFINGCKLLSGTPEKFGGSNKYPHPVFKEGFCIVEIVSKGFPCFSEWEHQYKVQVLEFRKIVNP
jgi:hypothetical protein